MASKSRKALVRQARTAFRAEPWALLPEAHAELQQALFAGDINTSFARLNDRRGEWEDAVSDPGYQVRQGVAVVDVQGVMRKRADAIDKFYGLMGYEQLDATLTAAEQDTSVKAIVLNIDSPGGSVLGVRETADRIRSATKPVFAVGNAMMASAAYYLGAAASKVFAAPGAMVGSIGTLTVHSDVSKWRHEIGVTDTIIRAGENKVLDHPYQPLSDKGREQLQANVDSYYGQFVQDVAKYRNVTSAHVEARYGQGKVFTAEEAVALGMIDGVATLSQVVNLAASLVDAADTNANVVLANGASLTPMSRQQVPAVQVSVPEAAVGGVNIHTTPSASITTTTNEVRTMKKVIAQLIVMGLLESHDAPENVVQAVLGGFFAACGQAVPAGEEAILAGLKQMSISPVSGTAAEVAHSAAQPATAGTGATAGGTGASIGTTGAGIQQIVPAPVAADERQRILDADASRRLTIAAVARSYGLPADDELVAACVANSAIDATEANRRILERQAAQETPVPRGRVGNVTQRGAADFAADCQAALSHRCDTIARREPRANQPAVTERQRQLSRTPLSRIARQCLVTGGLRLDDAISDEDVARWALGAHTAEIQREMSAALGGGSAYNHPSSFPTLFSNLMNRELDVSMDLAPISYTDWAYRGNDAADMRPSINIQTGGLTEFSAVNDGDEGPEDSMGEEVTWIVPDFYKKQWRLTPLMIVNDDLGALTDAASGFGEQWQRTVNRLCLRILVENPAAADGAALFHSNHGNLAGSGAVFSLAELNTARSAFRKQKGIARTNNGVAARLGLGSNLLVLSGAKYETSIEQTLAPYGTYPVSEGTVNTLRGKVRYNIDTMLDDYEATAGALYLPWFVLEMSRAVQTVIYKFQAGYGNLRRTEEYKPNTGCMHYYFEGRVGAAIRNWRGAYRNPGA